MQSNRNQDNPSEGQLAAALLCLSGVALPMRASNFAATPSFVFADMEDPGDHERNELIAAAIGTVISFARWHLEAEAVTKKNAAMKAKRDKAREEYKPQGVQRRKKAREKTKSEKAAAAESRGVYKKGSR